MLEKKTLDHNDRVVFGTGSAFLFKHPGKETKSRNAKFAETDLDWEFAQSEIVDKIEKTRRIKFEQFELEKKAESNSFSFLTRAKAYLLIHSGKEAARDGGTIQKRE